MTDRHFRVWRGDESGGEIRDYDVEVNDGEVVLDIIHRLQATQAPDLACRWNCKAGKCGSCSMEINGKPRLGCMTRMSTFGDDETVTITPLRTFPVIRDLVTDVSFNYVKARETPAFAPPSLAPGDYRMQQVDVERSQEFRKCIECFLCQNTCHVVRDHEENKAAFSGPRYFIRAAELDMHPLDARSDRKEYAQASQGLGYCNITKCCTEVCPEHIKITDNAIIPLKERVVDKRYDPLVWLGRKILRRDQVPGAAPAPVGEGGIPSRGVDGKPLGTPAPAGSSMAPSSTAGVTDVASGLGDGHVRLPEAPPVGADGRMDVAELLATNAGGPSPFGDDQQFPLAQVTYRPPEPDKD
ncbi:succinate dehydrogenase/fumarate reductase iron-sulfur subunit [Symbioplanes lichenis]|uniref:succinate dehydrogenase/fumarate reductase iron-sulfur subunit n=1 Tax=Symbioplanes lichenis TaxID=1629072 RepID=UPI002739D3B1|nr:succinate dehydrogenase/fumarate reductase iron-sulfur subunit [Actinoplanes lichenis]